MSERIYAIVVNSKPYNLALVSAIGYDDRENPNFIVFIC